ncbi:Fic family protein [Sulfurimonas sp. SAG-AH-194-C20]|nr:Fic family protein [Sulfurimonas sp. SAG-AH-194-C20]MDF1878429.1 Fic family protein [Sulfurimonas sp. SAG-AH-194-C20]
MYNKWIWQHKEYPSFKYDIKEFVPKLTQIAENVGRVKALISLLNEKEQDSIKIDLLTNEIVSTSAIEGEQLSRDSVRSSIGKKLDANFSEIQDRSTYHTDALAAILIDSTQNREDLSLERLHKWHISLLSHTPNKFTKIELGSFRKYDDMQIVSGSIGKEKVHYVALPHQRISKDMKNLLKFINTSSDNIYIKSALAHLWFVTIHPYDDGNGRIARIIGDYVVSKSFGLEYKYFTISAAIAKHRKDYYNRLEETQNLHDNPNVECSLWVEWYLEMFNNSLEDTLSIINKVISKAKFWDKIRDVSLNSRQIKVLKKLLEYDDGEFQGGLTSKKYVAMTKVSIATAKRDIQELLKYECVYQIEGSQGRNVKYAVNTL